MSNNKLTVKERKNMFRRWIFSAGLGYNYESQQAPSVAFSMRNAVGAVLWMLMYIAFYWLKMWLFNLGYESGTKLITTLGEKINVFTDAISIMGLMVVGSLVPAVVKVYTPLKFATGKVSLSLQKGIFDKIMPGLLPVCLALLVYWLLGKKSWTPTRIILLIILICLIGAATGILGIAA